MIITTLDLAQLASVTGGQRYCASVSQECRVFPQPAPSAWRRFLDAGVKNREAYASKLRAIDALE